MREARNDQGAELGSYMSAVNDVEHTIRQTSLLGQTSEDLCRQKYNESDMNTYLHITKYG